MDSAKSVTATFQKPYLDDITGGFLTIGATNTLTGEGFTSGSVILLWVATATGTTANGPYTPSAWTTTSLTWDMDPTIALGNGFGTVMIVNTDEGYSTSNMKSALLYGDAADNIPTILTINGTALSPLDPAYATARADVVVDKGATITITGTGFNSPGVNLYTASGNIGPLWPLAGGTSTSIQIVIPTGAPTGPGNFQLVNSPFTGNVMSNAVSSVIGATPTITSISIVGNVFTVTGTGFCSLTVINLFNVQGGGVVNLGGYGAGGAPNIPLYNLTDTQFQFDRPAGAAAGAAYMQVINPPYVPFSTSGSDPDGAFTMP